jgi:outer membrane protein OmpA-like peptidoglycan-associated protein
MSTIHRKGALFFAVGFSLCSSVAAHAETLGAPRPEFALAAQKQRIVLEALNPYAVKVFSTACSGVATWAAATAGMPGACASRLLDKGTVSASAGDGALAVLPGGEGVYVLSSAAVAALEDREKPTVITWRSEGETITTVSSATPEQKRLVIKRYLDRLAGENKLAIQLTEHSDFDKSSSRLLDNIKNALPKYYRLKNNTPQAELVPAQQRMYYTYGDYTGNLELPHIPFSDSPAPVVLKTAIVNDVLPAYSHGDDTVKLSFKDSDLKITNKSDKTVHLEAITLACNGRFIDRKFSPPLVLAPQAASGELSFAYEIEQELGLEQQHTSMTAQQAQQRKTHFGFGAAYKNPLERTPKIIALVNTYSVNGNAGNPGDTERLEKHMASLASGSTQEKVEVFVENQYDFAIRFAFGKASMENSSLEKLKKAGQAMKENPRIRGMIEGHSDNVGSTEANMNLSTLRANAVKEYLVTTFSIAPDRIETKGFGVTKPVADNCTLAGREQNRRVEGRFWVK